MNVVCQSTDIHVTLQPQPSSMSVTVQPPDQITATVVPAAGVSAVVQTTAPIVATVTPATAYSVSLEVGQGPAGPSGTGGSGQTLFEAAAAIQAGRAVAMQPDGRVVHASADNLAHGYTVVGISPVAVAQGNQVVPASVGSVQNASWNWTAGNVLLGLDGQLVQTVPVGALYALVIGRGSGDRIAVRPSVPVFLRG